MLQARLVWATSSGINSAGLCSARPCACSNKIRLLGTLLIPSDQKIHTKNLPPYLPRLSDRWLLTPDQDAYPTPFSFRERRGKEMEIKGGVWRWRESPWKASISSGYGSYCAHCLAAALAACPRSTQDWGHQSSIDQGRIHRAVSYYAELVATSGAGAEAVTVSSWAHKWPSRALSGSSKPMVTQAVPD